MALIVDPWMKPRTVRPARRHPVGPGTWLGIVGTVLLLAAGACTTLSAPGDPGAGADIPVAIVRPAMGGIVVASSSDGIAAVRARVVSSPATPTGPDWFATVTAEQAAAIDDVALRAVSGRPVGRPPPPALSPAAGPAAAARPGGEGEPSARGKPRPEGARVPSQASGQPATAPRRAAPPPPLDTSTLRATAQAAIRSAAATPMPADDRAQASAQQRAQSQAPVSSGYSTVQTRIAVAAAQRPPATPRPYRTRVPAWTPSPTGPTPTLAPTRTPARRSPTPPSAQATRGPFIPPTPRNGDNKWGVGVYRTSNEVLATVRETQPGVVLLMDPDEGWARKVREAAPNAFIVGRRYRREDDQPLDNPVARGEDMADWVAELAVPMKGVVDAWMSYNEVVAHNAYEDYKRYDQFQAAFARRLQDVHGIAAVANNDGSGAVEPQDYPKYFAESIRVSQYFGLHAYSPPATDKMPIDAEWNALRYRKIHDELERAGIRGKQMVVTESGLGDGFGGVATEDEMAADFAWFTRELQKDPYMIGHASFGLFNGTGAWDRFELTGTQVPGLVRRLLSS